MFKKNKTTARSILLVSILFLPATFLLAQFVSVPSFGIPFDLNGWLINTIETGTVLTDSQERQIDAHGICKKVQATDGKMYFVPTRSQTEWETFINKAPNGVNINQCSCDNIEWQTVNLPVSMWESVDLSLDGQSIVAVILNNWTNTTSDDYVYISHDGGQNFTKSVPLGAGGWTYVSMSGDGQTIVLHSNNKGVYISKDGGVSWRRVNELGAPHTAFSDISFDGNKIIVTVSLTKYANGYGYVYISNDGGQTWQKQSGLGAKHWGVPSIVENNPNVAYVINVDNGQFHLYKTNDFGNNWSLALQATPHYDNTLSVPYVSTSPSGKFVFVNDSISVGGGSWVIHQSTDYGATWEPLTLAPYTTPLYPSGSINFYVGGVFTNKGVLCIRRMLANPVCSFDGGKTFVEQQDASGAGPWYLGWGRHGIKVVGDTIIVSGVLNPTNGSASNVYIGKCN